MFVNQNKIMKKIVMALSMILIFSGMKSVVLAESRTEDVKIKSVETNSYDDDLMKFKNLGNNGIAEATNLEEGQIIHSPFGNIYNLDYFEIELRRSGHIEILSSQQLGSIEDYNVVLMSSDVEIIKESEIITKENKQFRAIDMHNLEPGTYYIVVVPKKNRETEWTYNLSYSFNPEDLAIDKLEFGDSKYILRVGEKIDLKEILDIDLEIYDAIDIRWSGMGRDDLGSLDSDGIFQCESVGIIEMTASYGDLRTKTDFIVGRQSDDIPQRRAILIGNTDYPGDKQDLKGPKYDVERMEKIFSESEFGDAGEFTYIQKYNDITKFQLEDAIKYLSDIVGPEDITYIYYSGHGMSHENTSYLSLIEGYVSVGELKSYLDELAGVKVVILDCCNSGGFINKASNSDDYSSIEDELESMDRNIIETFSATPKAGGFLNEGSYKVITASSASELSVEFTGVPPYGLFTKVLADSSGYYGNYPSDLNGDGGLTLRETYEYIYNRILLRNPTQHAQIYPENTDFEWMSYSPIRDISVKGIHFENETKTITVGDTGDTIVEIDPLNATNDSVYYYSEDSDILSITGDGKFRALKSGETKIHAISIDGLHEAEQSVVVNDLFNPDEGIVFYKDLMINDNKKVWTIDFSSNVSEESIVNGIYVSETREGIKLNGIELEVRENSVLVNPPISGWYYDKYYYLHVKDSVKSESGSSLRESEILRFRIQR